MKKTISINIAGLVFNIEEDGYIILKKYLDEIKSLFSSEEGLNEMLEDIEARIAELFHAKLNASKQVITELDVAEVIDLMGQPTDYEVDDDPIAEEKKSSSSSEQDTQQKTSKRLYRDEENASVGGVCAGLGHYFDIDPIIIRIIFVLMVILGGSGVLIYIILWIVVPEAKTTAQKLQMRGQPVNLDNIKEYVSSFTKDAKGGVNNAANTIKRSVNRSSSAISAVFNVVGKFIGFGFLFGGIIAIVVISVIFFGDSELLSFTSAELDNNLRTLFNSIYPDGSSKWSFWSLFLIIVLPLLTLSSIGLKLLFNYKGKFKKPSFGGLILWIIAVCVFTYTSIEMGLQFKSEYEIDEKIEYVDKDSSNVLLIEMDYTNNNVFEIDSDEFWQEHDYFFIDEDSIEIGFPSFKVIRDSTLEDYSITLKKRSNGRTPKQAMENAKAIQFSPKIKGNTIYIPCIYSIPTASKIRAQHVTVELRIPLGKSVKIPATNNAMLYEIYSDKDVDYDDTRNETHWISTKNGMKCINCEED
ncbi:MAG: PspC domain-containing protein [Brumimicrobium sp.]